MDNKPVTAEKARRRLNSDTVYYIVNTAILVLLTLIVVYPLFWSSLPFQIPTSY